MADREDYPSVAYGAGIPPSVTAMTVAVPFNDADALERRIVRLEAEGRAPACLIMEAALMNCGVILPEPGYLDRVREITRRHGIVWIVDEVKTGLTIAPGGACEYFGIEPDIICLAKALGGGLPSAAIGATHEMMEPVLSGRVCMVGTYNGNPLVMAATRANLLDVMTPDAYAHLEHINRRLLDERPGRHRRATGSPPTRSGSARRGSSRSPRRSSWTTRRSSGPRTSSSWRSPGSGT